MATEIQTLKPGEKLDTTTSKVSYLGAMTELASTPSAIANLGVQMASSASQTYQALRGAEAGKTPSNTLLPPITKADEAFVKGYSAQAQQTLGLQAQQLINNAKLDLEKNYQLSNGQIASYQKNVAQGLQQIIDQAPYTIKNDLANQYSQALQNDVFALNSRLLSQQKTQAKEQASVYLKTQMSQMTDAIMRGGQGSQTIYENSQKYINDKQASGMWSPAEAEAQRKSMKQLYLNNVLGKQAIEAYQNKNLEGYLNSLTNVPTEINGVKVDYNEFDSARNHALSTIQNYERFTASQQNLIVSDAKIRFAEGNLGQDEISSLREQLEPQKFNELYGYVLNHQASQLKSQQRLSELLANKDNIDVMSRATKKEIDSTYDASVAQIKQEAFSLGKNISNADAEFQTVNSIPVQIPAVNNSLANKLMNGDPQTALEAASQVARIENAGLSARLDTRFTSNTGTAGIIATEIQRLLPFSASPEEAVSKARQVAFPTEEQKNAAKQLQQQFNKNYGNAKKRIKFARKLASPPSDAKIPDEASFYLNVANAYQDALAVFGNEDAAANWVQKGVERNYGVTRINGTPQYTFMPIENIPGVGQNATPVIQQDIYRDVSRYVENMKAIYDATPNLGFYYELAPRVSYDDFARAQLNPNDANSKAIIKDFLKAEPIKITKVYRDTGERIDYNLEVKAGPYASLGTSEDLAASGYDYVLRNKDGGIESFYGTFGTNGRIPFYSPNTKYIKDAALTIHQAQQETFQSRLEEYLKKPSLLKGALQRTGIAPGAGTQGIRTLVQAQESDLAKELGAQ